MKSFKFKFTKLTLVFIYLGIALSAAAFALNTYFVIVNGIKTAANPVYPILQYSLMYFVSVLLSVILISLLLSTYYSVDDKYLKTSFGVIKSKYPVGDIESIVLDRTTNKLSVYFKDDNFIVIVVKEDWYEDFTDALLKANPKIEFSIKSKDADPKDKDDKNKKA